MTGSGFKKDPAIERWAAMREHTHFYYRFNFRKIIPTAVLLIGIPAGIVYFSLKSFVRTGTDLMGSGVIMIIFYGRLGL